MKNLKSLVWINLVAMMLLMAAQVQASSITSLEIEPLHHQKKFLLTLKAKGKGIISLQIFDQDQNIIFLEKIESITSFGKKFNLEHLQKGNYTLQVEDELRITYQPLTINEEEVAVDSQLMKVIHKPYVKTDMEENHFDVNWMMNEYSNYQLRLEDKNERILFSDDIEDTIKIHKRYDITKLKKGSYYLILKNSKVTYHKTILIK